MDQLWSGAAQRQTVGAQTADPQGYISVPGKERCIPRCWVKPKFVAHMTDRQQVSVGIMQHSVVGKSRGCCVFMWSPQLTTKGYIYIYQIRTNEEQSGEERDPEARWSSVWPLCLCQLAVCLHKINIRSITVNKELNCWKQQEDVPPLVASSLQGPVSIWGIWYLAQG